MKLFIGGITVAVGVILIGIFMVILYQETSLQSSSGYTYFDEYNVVQVIEDQTVVAGEVVSFGPIDVSKRKGELLLMLHGTTGGDSLKTLIKLWGLMSQNPADTLKSSPVYTSGVLAAADSVYAWPDTLSGDEYFPFLFGQVHNRHADSSAVFNLYLHMKPDDITLLRR